MQKISVIITSYNQKEYLREAIESVLFQTLRPIEIIVCDDASSDGSQELIGDYEKKHTGLLRGILHENNIGISRNRNSGLEAARCDLVTWLDGDDRFRPKKLELELENYLADTEVKWVYSQVMLIDESGRVIRERYSEPCEGMIFEKVISMLGRAPRNPLVEYESLKKIGFFNEGMHMYEDFDLCLRLSKNFKCSYRPEPLMEYRTHPDGAHKQSLQKHLSNLDKLHKNFLNLVFDYPEFERKDLERKLLSTIDRIKRGGNGGDGSVMRIMLNMLYKIFGLPRK